MPRFPYTGHMGATGFTLGRLARALLWSAASVLATFAIAMALGEEPLDYRLALTPGTAEETIFFSLRLPRVLLAALVGAALSASGATLQPLLRNSLADPFVLGVSGGAALGATVALALGLPAFTLLPGVSAASVFALSGAAGATFLVLAVGRWARGNVTQATLLAGVIFNSVALAGITFIKVLVAPDRLGEVLFWLTGSIGQETVPTLVATAIAVALALGVMVALSGRLNLMTLGEEDAHSLGVDVESTRRWLLVACSVAVAAVASLSGLVAFVGLVVPHLVRLLVGVDQRMAVPVSALLGASFLMLADLLARVLFRVFHTEPPVGAITALVGGTVFLVLMARAKRGGASGTG